MQEIKKYVEDNKQRFLDELFELLRFPSVSADPKYKGDVLKTADFVAQKDTGIADYWGGFAVTSGIGVDELVAEYVKNFDDYNSIMVKALADRLAEAFAERMHERVRKEFWGYAHNEELTNEELIKEKYKGIRPAPGYPA